MFARYGGKGVLLSRVQRSLGEPWLRVAVGANLGETRFVGYQHGGVGLREVVETSTWGYISTTIFGRSAWHQRGRCWLKWWRVSGVTRGFDIIEDDDG